METRTLTKVSRKRLIVKSLILMIPKMKKKKKKRIPPFRTFTRKRECVALPNLFF
jgi:hypothetical protein